MPEKKKPSLAEKQSRVARLTREAQEARGKGASFVNSKRSTSGYPGGDLENAAIGHRTGQHSDPRLRGTRTDELQMKARAATPVPPKTKKVEKLNTGPAMRAGASQPKKKRK